MTTEFRELIAAEWVELNEDMEALKRKWQARMSAPPGAPRHAPTMEEALTAWRRAEQAFVAEKARADAAEDRAARAGEALEKIEYEANATIMAGDHATFRRCPGVVGTIARAALASLRSGGGA